MNHSDHSYEDCPDLKRRYYGPCRAGLHPEFGWGKPCLEDATDYVEVHEHIAPDIDRTALMRLCPDHTIAAVLLPGFHSRKPLEPPALTYERPEVQS